MAAPARRIHSNATPAKRTERAEDTREGSTRPALHVVKNERAEASASHDRLQQFLEWTRSRTAPFLQIVVSSVFLVATLVIALGLRTQMASNSFESNQTENHIEQLQQDIQSDQTKLDSIQASLPQKAQDMGMVAQQDSVTIDLNGYQPSDGGK